MTISRRNFLIMPLVLAACKAGASVIETSGMTMGTTFNVVAVDPAKSVGKAELDAAIQASLAEVNRQMSNWDPASEISRFNARRSTGATPVSAELAQVIAAAGQVHAASDGRFDITVGPLIDAWGFGAADARGTAPDEARIAAALEICGQDRTLRLENGQLRKSAPGVEIYLSAIGKGYGVDRVARAVESLGIREYMVEIGGDLYTSGRNPEGRPWQIGVETPDAGGRSVLKVVETSGLGMATSGDYRNYFEQDGVRYSHLIDPQSGRPITHATTSATVLTENAMLADAWATAMLVLGRERGLEIAERLDLAALFVERGTGTGAPFVITQSSRFAALQA